MINLILRKKLFLTASLLLAIVVVLPHVVTPFFLDKRSSYTPFSLSTKSSQMEFEEMYAYASETQAFLREGGRFGDVHAFEYRHFPSPSLSEFFPSIIYGLLTQTTGSIESAFIIGDFIFPFLTSFLLMEFLFKLVKNRHHSVFISMLIIFFWSIIYYLPYPIETINYLFGWPVPDTIFIARAFNPQIPFLLLLIFLNAFFASKQRPFLSGLILGAMFYTYIFYWQMSVTFLLIWSLILVYKSRRWTAAFPIVKVLFTALLVASPYFLNAYSFANSSLAGDFVLRTTLPLTELIPGSLSRYLAFSVLVVIFSWLKKINLAIVASLLFSSLLTAVASGLLLQRDLENFHYVRRWFFPFSIIALFYFGQAISASPKLKFLSRLANRKIIIILCATILSIATVNQLRLAYSLRADKTISSNRRDLYSWIKVNTTSESVIGSIDVVDALAVNSYTGRFIYLPPGDRTLVPTTENIQRAFYLGHLLGIDSEKVSAMLIDQRSNFPGNGRFSSHVLGFRLHSYPKSAITKIGKEVCQPGARLDYLLITPKIVNFVKVSSPVVYRNSDYLIYNVSNENTNNIRRCSVL